MKKENIRSNELKRVIAMKTGNMLFEDVSEEELDSVDELYLRAKKYSGEPTDIDLSEVSGFTKLKTLGLNGFELSTEDFSIISKLGLSTLELNGCETGSVVIDTADSLENLVINGGKIVDSEVRKSPKLLIVSETDVDFSKFDMSKTKRIFMRNCTIRNVGDLNSLTELEEINFDGSKVYDISGTEIKEVNVADNVMVSFEDEVIKAGIEEI